MNIKLRSFKASRKLWWLSLFGLLLGISAAYWIHTIGISRWLKRIDETHTAIAVVILLASITMFCIVSKGRMNDIKVTNKSLLLIVFPPVWILILGLTPSSKSETDYPAVRSYKAAACVAVIATCLAIATAFTKSNNSKETANTIYQECEEAIISQSDDYTSHRASFCKATTQLINNGTCSRADFIEMGGWISSPEKGAGNYFTYCGGMHIKNRIYLNVNSGSISK